MCSTPTVARNCANRVIATSGSCAAGFQAQPARQPQPDPAFGQLPQPWLRDPVEPQGAAAVEAETVHPPDITRVFGLPATGLGQIGDGPARVEQQGAPERLSLTVPSAIASQVSSSWSSSDVVPPGTTPKMMMLVFANFLGLLVPNKATAQDLTEQIVGVMRSLSVSLVLSTRYNNLKTNHQAGSEAASALKVFSERLDATFIYAGIRSAQADLFAGHIGRQLKGRMAVHQMRTYDYGTKAQRRGGPSWFSVSKPFCPWGVTSQDRLKLRRPTCMTAPAGRSVHCAHCSTMRRSRRSSTAKSSWPQATRHDVD